MSRVGVIQRCEPGGQMLHQSETKRKSHSVLVIVTAVTLARNEEKSDR